MKKVRVRDIEAKKIITKAELARRLDISHTQLNRQIKKCKWTIIITLDDKELVYLD